MRQWPVRTVSQLPGKKDEVDKIMKTGRTIQEIGAELMRQSQAKEDYLVNTGSIVMEDWGGRPMLHLQGENKLDLIEPLEIQQTAHRQIGDYLNIPRKYYDRLMEKDVGLLTYNVNRWFQREPEHSGQPAQPVRQARGERRTQSARHRPGHHHATYEYGLPRL